MALSDDIRQLTEIPVLRLLDPEALRLLAFAADTKLLRAGDVLFREGDVADGAYLLTTGSIDIQARHDPSLFAVAAPVLLGEMALLTETVRPATATAHEPSTLRHIPRTLFRRVLDESPSSAGKIRAMIVTRIAEHATRLDAFARDDIPR